MSLLTEQMEAFVLMEKTRVPDGYGGLITLWAEGAEIQAVAPVDQSMEARTGAMQGVTSLYTITTTKAINLQYHDVLKRVRDGKIFRVTSDGDDNRTPASATLNMRNVTAEEWILPDSDTEAGV